MLQLALAGLFFILIHIGVAGTTLRDRIVARLGDRGYMVLFATLSIAGIAWLGWAYRRADYVPLWGNPDWAKLLADIGMLPAFVLVAAGLATPNPTAVGQEARASRPPEGLLRVTRHPFLIGVALWATLHLIANGDVASLLLFGALLAIALAGPASIDAKRRRRLGGPAWDGFAAQTSVVPFAAIAAGRQTFSLREIGWKRLLAGVLAYAVFIGGHRHIIGVSPFPHW